MKRNFAQSELRFLRGYAIVMSLIAAVFFIGAAGNRSASFDTIDAHAINIRDADGSVRLALFGKNGEPPDILAGKSYSGRSGGPQADAGLMFYNERRDEIGGLIFGVHDGPNGIEQAQSLTFDGYKQDQVVQLMHEQVASGHSAGLIVNDVPKMSLVETLPTLERVRALPQALAATEIRRLRAQGFLSRRRLFAGIDSNDATLVLRDALGRPRLRLSVGAAGAGHIDFLDGRGRVVRTLRAGAK